MIPPYVGHSFVELREIRCNSFFPAFFVVLFDCIRIFKECIFETVPMVLCRLCQVVYFFLHFFIHLDRKVLHRIAIFKSLCRIGFSQVVVCKVYPQDVFIRIHFPVLSQHDAVIAEFPAKVQSFMCLAYAFRAHFIDVFRIIFGLFKIFLYTCQVFCLIAVVISVFRINVQGLVFIPTVPNTSHDLGYHRAYIQ